MNQILIWSIINSIPLRQFDPDDIHLLFYENVVTNPIDEINAIWRHIKPSRQEKAPGVDEKLVRTPSRVSDNKKDALSSETRVSGWKDKLDGSVIDEGMNILARFGLEKLYGDDSMPNIDVIHEIRKS